MTRSLEDHIRALTIHERMRIYRTDKGIYVIRDISGFHPKVRVQYLARDNEWVDTVEGVDFDTIEPWERADEG